MVICVIRNWVFDELVLVFWNSKLVAAEIPEIV